MEVGGPDVIIERLDGDASTLDETTKNCIHEVVKPKGWNSQKLEPGYEPATKFAYALDPFQETAIEAIEMNESVLVAAHTSAGKTTVAEYAIASALKKKSRVIYTAPIKALSNQKYRDLQEQFEEVGLMTGDVTLNPNASVIIMTTEILRSILYRGSELVREVKWVIFDEIHYMRDRERGVIWEETIVLLPDSVRQVFLSATIPNTLEFAEWICRTKHQPCHVVSTNYRPTPLQHFLFPAGGEGLTLVMNEHKEFQEENYRSVLKQLEFGGQGEDHRPRKGRRGGTNSSTSDLERILSMCNERNFTPVIVFAFSKREVEDNAGAISSLDLTTEQEKEDISKIFESALSTLSEKDRNLPQVRGVLPHLLKGIGIHHGGLLPMVKEVTEILFQELLIKVLFSTETFSMGINMPARTVVFTGLYKFDGKEKRIISPGEYIQMSGRAGRRGIDSRGISIVMLKSKEDEEQLKKLFTGQAFRLDSHFYLKYNTILNLTRVEGVDPDYMIKRSFLQFQNMRSTITLEERKNHLVRQLETEETLVLIMQAVFAAIRSQQGGDSALKAWRGILPAPLNVQSEDEIECAIIDYTELCNLWQSHLSFINAYMLRHTMKVIKFLQRGRVVRVYEQGNPGRHWGYGVVVNMHSKRQQAASDIEVYCDVVLRVHESTNITRATAFTLTDMQPHPSADALHKHVLFGTPTPPVEKLAPHFEAFRVPLSAIIEITNMRCKMDVEADNQCEEFRMRVGMKLLGLLSKQPILKRLHPVNDIELPECEEINKAIEGVENVEEELRRNCLYGWQYTEKIVEGYKSRVAKALEVQEIEAQLHAANQPANIVQLKAMTEVLRRLEYLDKNGVATVKGRACCDLTAVDTLVTGELLFEFGKMWELTPDYLCAMMSILVHEEPSKFDVPLNDPHLQTLYDLVLSKVNKVISVSQQCGIDIDADAYLAKFSKQLMIPARDWVRDRAFGDIMKENEHLYEGSVVRSFRRLEEGLRECAACAHSMGSAELEKLFTLAIHNHRKGIVFQASLYL